MSNDQRGIAMDQINPGHSSIYNALVPITEAKRSFYERVGDAAVNTLLSIITDANAEAVVGIRLLHKHNDISPSEIMLEVARSDETGFALITAPESRDCAGRIMPNSWQLTNQGFVPVEFSQSGILSSGFHINENEDLFLDFVKPSRRLGFRISLGRV